MTLHDSADRERRFTEIYRTNEWNGAETRSGRGSGLAETEQVVRILDVALIVTGARRLLDAGCGERRWLHRVKVPLDCYVGIDIVAPLADGAAKDGPAPMPAAWPRVELRRADIVADPLPEADLVLCRDVLPHFSDAAIRATLANFRRSGAAWLLTTSFPGRPNADIPDGDWRPIDLEAAPFDLPPPAHRWREDCPLDGGRYADKCLCLWRLAELELG